MKFSSMVSRSRITAPLVFTLALPSPNHRHGHVHARPPPSKSPPHDGGKVRKKRRLVKLRDQLPPSEDNNKKLSDLSATARRPTGTHLVVAQISGPPAKSHAMPPTVSESQLSQTLADLRALAVDFFYEEDHNVPAVVKHVFGTFRSMVYRKSLYNTSGDAHRPLSVVESESSLVPLRTIPKAVDRPTDRKRAKSDSSEEPSAKGIKKPKMLEAVTKPKPSQQLGSEKDVVEQKLKQKLGSTKKKVVNALTALQQAELQPMSSESAAVRVAAELPKNHVDKTETEKSGDKMSVEKSGIVKAAALPARQPAEFPSVKKIVDVKLQKSCIKKGDEKGTTTKEVRISVGSTVGPPTIHPSELNAARIVQLVPAPGPTPAGAALCSVDGDDDGRVDISTQMMTLLVKCNKLVDVLKPLIGNVHPL